MRELVLDASVLATWYHPEGEPNVEAAQRLKAEYERGELLVAVPPLLHVELMNLAGRRWRFVEADLLDLARALRNLQFTVQQPDLENVARWTGRGLTAYDACYVALAEERRISLVTADRQMLAIGGPLCIALA